MTFNWRALPPDVMEQHFNPRAAVSDVDARLEDFIARSAAARDAMPGEYDLRYGERPKETLDVHAPPGGGSARALVMFLHGGYWRALDKNDHSFVVPPILASGAVVANVNYDLCPDVTLDVIVDEIANAVRFCHAHAASWGADPNAIHLLGHSAGAHLAAEMMLRDWDPEELTPGAIRGVAALTGVYEPEVILSVTVNEEARIERDTALGRSCLDRSFTMNPATVLGVGGDEPPGWIGQSQAFHRACLDAGIDARLHIAPGANHFSVLDSAITDGDPLNDAVFGLWRPSQG